MTDVEPPADESRTLTEVRAHVVALSNSLNKYREDLAELTERVTALEGEAFADD